MEWYYYLLLVVLLGIGFIAIRNSVRFKKSKKEASNKVWQYVPIDYIKGTREYYIFNYLNAAIIARGGTPLKADAGITAKTLNRVAEMDASDVIDHSESHDELLELKIDGSDGSADLISKYYHDPKTVVGAEPVLNADGEVIKKGYGWFGSEKHRRAIMNPRYDYCAVSSLKRANGRWIDVLMLVDEKTIN